MGKNLKGKQLGKGLGQHRRRPQDRLARGGRF